MERVVGAVRERLERGPATGETIDVDVSPCADGHFSTVTRQARGAEEPPHPDHDPDRPLR